MEKLKVKDILDKVYNFDNVKVYDWHEVEQKKIFNKYADNVLNAEIIDLIPELFGNDNIILLIYADIRN